MYTTTKTTGSRTLVLVVMVATIALASMAIVAAEARAQAGSFSDEFPKLVLKKGETKLQAGRFYYGTWNWYEAGEWNSVHADGIGGFPQAETVRAGSRLHIKINKPERPANFSIRAYRRVDQFSNPIGTGKLLNTTLRPVEREGKTVGWKVFFRVNEADRHFYLETGWRWERVPSTHISHGHTHENYHVKTTE